MKKFISLFLTICMILSLTSAFTITVSAKNIVTVDVKVTATRKSDGVDEAVNGAWVSVFHGQGMHGDDVKFLGAFKSKTTEKGKGYAQCEIEIPDYIDINDDEKVNEYLSKLTFSAQKVVASSKGIDGNNRDALFDVYQEPRLQLELHSEVIDKNGNWLGKKLPIMKSDKVDLAFVVDVSGSMQGTIDNVKNNIRAFSKYLEDEGLDLRIAIIEYNNSQSETHLYGHDKLYEELGRSVWFDNVDDMEQILGTLRATGGSTENPIDGLGFLVDNGKMTWRSDAYKFAFLLTDESGITLSDNRWGYTSMQQLASDLYEEDIMTSVVMKQSRAFTDLYGPLYQVTGGANVNIESSDFSKEMITLADKIIGKTNKELELHLSEPRLLVNLSVCYYNDESDAQFTFMPGGDPEERLEDSMKYWEIKNMMKRTSKTIAQTTDGHILLNKVYIFNTNNRDNFYVRNTGEVDSNGDPIPNYDSALTSAMADIRIEADYNEDGTWGNKKNIWPNAMVAGFYRSACGAANAEHFLHMSEEEITRLLSNKSSFARVQLSANYGSVLGMFGTSMWMSAYSETLTHELGHYLMGFRDEYEKYKMPFLSENETDPVFTAPFPSEAPEEFGLMDDQDKEIELSSSKTYAYLNGNYTDRGSNTEHSFEQGCSCEDSLATLLEEGIQVEQQAFHNWYANISNERAGTNLPIITQDNRVSLFRNRLNEYTGEVSDFKITYTKRSNMRRAKYPYAELSDDDFVDLRQWENWTKGMSSASTSASTLGASFNNRVQTSENLAEIKPVANGNKVTLEFSPNNGNILELYVKKPDGGLGSIIEKVEITDNKAEIELDNGRACELIVITEKDGKSLCNTHILERSFKSDKGYYYQSSDLTVEGYVIPDSEDEFIFMTVGTSFENGNYVSVNNSLKIESANDVDAKGEIYSVASVNGNIDYTTISWFKYADGEYTKLDTDLTTEENMNIGARCDYDGEGTYVLMAKLASDEGLQAVTNLDYTNPTDRDGIVNLTFDDPNSDTVYYNIYYSDKKFSSIDDENVVMEKRYAGSDSYSIDLGERNATGYAAVVAIAENGAKSKLSDVIKIITDEADRDGDGIPDWYCDKYSLWPESGEEKDIANSDDDKDGLTNLEEYKGGSDPTDPNDPRKTSKTAVKSVSLSDSSINLSPGGSSVVNAKLNPSDATNKNVKWYVDDSSIATVSVDGLSCDILGIKEGTTKVTVVTEDGGYTASVTVKVAKSSSSVSFKPSGKDYYVLKDVAVSNGYEYFDYPEKKSANIRSASYILAFQDNNKLVSYKTVLGDTGIVELDKAIYEDGGKLYVSAIDLQTKLVKYFPNFPTSTPSEWAEEEIARAINAGLVTDSVKVNYQRNITREQFCELVVKLYEKTTGKTVSKEDNRFNDTNNSEIVKAYNLGIVNGISKTKFAPYNLVTRQEICAMLVRAVDAMHPSVDINDYQYHSFNDNDKISSWAMPSVQFAYDNDIMKGVGANEISPLGNTTCEQAILLINRAYENRSKFE